MIIRTQYFITIFYRIRGDKQSRSPPSVNYDRPPEFVHHNRMTPCGSAAVLMKYTNQKLHAERSVCICFGFNICDG